MRNRFKLNESDKNHIRGLHGISEQGSFMGDITKGVGNIFNTRDDGHTISKDRIIRILKEIKRLQDEDAPAIAQSRLEELFEKVGLTSGGDIDTVDIEVEEPEVEVEVEDEEEEEDEE